MDKLPKSEQARAKRKIHNIYMAATQEDAMKAWNSFLETYQAKYPKVVACLEKDRDELLTFYDFPAEHWIHLRTTNPIESTFSTVRHRTKKSKNCFSRETILSSVFKLLLEAEKRWKKLKGYKRLAEVINMEKFVNGVNINELEKQKNLEQKYAA